MKLEMARHVAKRAMVPLFFVHSTLRNFILLSHLPDPFSLVTTDHASGSTSSLCYPTKPEPVLCQPRTRISCNSHGAYSSAVDSCSMKKLKDRPAPLVLALFFLGSFLPGSLN